MNVSGFVDIYCFYTNVHNITVILIIGANVIYACLYMRACVCIFEDECNANVDICALMHIKC